MLLTVFIKAHIFSELCFLFLFPRQVRSVVHSSRSSITSASGISVNSASSMDSLDSVSNPGESDAPQPSAIQSAGASHSHHSTEVRGKNSKLECVFLVRLVYPVAASQVCFSATGPCITAQLPAEKRNKKKLPLSPNQKQKIHQTCSFSLSFSLFAVCEALLPGQRNLSDSEKHSRETRPPADQGDTLFILSSFLPPLLPA